MLNNPVSNITCYVCEWLWVWVQNKIIKSNKTLVSDINNYNNGNSNKNVISLTVIIVIKDLFGKNIFV